MGSLATVGALGLLVIVLGILLYIQSAKRTALGRALEAAQTKLEGFAPIRNVEEEVARRRKQMDQEISNKRSQIQEAIAKTKQQVARSRNQLDQEISQKRGQLQEAIAKTGRDIEHMRRNAQIEAADLTQRVASMRKDLAEAEARLREYEMKIDLEEMGFYQPRFVFDDALQYAEALDLVREAQRELVRQKLVLEGVTPQTPKASKNVAKLAADAFNGDATAIISDVTYSNFEASKQKLRAEYDKVNRLLEGTGIRISAKLLDLKIKEMAVAYDYREAEERARREQAEIKAMMKEEEEARVEAEETREKAIEKERMYQQALDVARQELESKSAEEREANQRKVQELEAQLQAAKADRERATSMAQITKKGHVYIISNIGSFGEDVFKIGQTRREEPKDRIRELGDASVPFEFDIHAMIKTDDAPGLETAIHNQFESKRMNKVNPRKEFFRVSIDEIAEVCEELGHRAHLTKIAEARDFRQTLAIEARAAGEARG